DDRRRPRLPINDGELACDLPGPKNGQDPLFAPRRSYNDFEKASFEPVATVAGISGGKKRVTGTQVTRFGARKQLRRQPLGQARQYGRGHRLRHRRVTSFQKNALSQLVSGVRAKNYGRCDICHRNWPLDQLKSLVERSIDSNHERREMWLCGPTRCRARWDGEQEALKCVRAISSSFSSPSPWAAR